MFLILRALKFQQINMPNLAEKKKPTNKPNSGKMLFSGANVKFSFAVPTRFYYLMALGMKRLNLFFFMLRFIVHYLISIDS